MRACVAILALAACGRAAQPPTTAAHATAIPPTAEAQPAGADDVVVATVDGHPVYGSCVAAQATALHLDRKAALDQCVQFELLAQAAEAKGLRQDPAVVEGWRREMVRALIKADLGMIDSLDMLPPDFVGPLMAKRGRLVHIPEMRAYVYARAEVPETAPLGSPEDRAAQAVADAAFAQLGPMDGVLPDEVVSAMNAAAVGTSVRVTADLRVHSTPPDFTARIRPAVKPFRDALYANPKIGTVCPPVRTQWGWDLILWDDTWAERDFTPELLDEARSLYFAQWADQIAAADGIAVQEDPTPLGNDEDETPDAGGGAP